MTLRDEFDAILRDFGFNILLIRQDANIRCSCWKEKEQESDRECPYCFGLGMVPIIEKHTVRDMVNTIPETLSRATTNTPFGAMAVPSQAFWMRYNVNVKTQDLIVPVEWSGGGKPVYTGGAIYEVNHVDPKRWERGEIIFKKVSVKDQPIQKSIRGINIVNTNGIKNYQIVEER